MLIEILPVFRLEEIGFCFSPGEDSSFLLAGDPAVHAKKKLKI